MGFLELPDEVLALIQHLAAKEGVPPDAIVAKGVRGLVRDDGAVPPSDA